MPTIHHLHRHIKRYGLNHRPLYALSLMLFFWCLFDGLLSYMAPIRLSEAGYSETQLGLIIGFSSVAGALFDLVVSKVFRRGTYRRIFLVMFLLSAVFPLLLWHGGSIAVFLLAMTMWGLYYDLNNIGTVSFLGLTMDDEEHASSSGVIQVFRSLGYLIAPLLAGLLLADHFGWRVIPISLGFLGVSFLFYLIFAGLPSRSRPVPPAADSKPLGMMPELKLLRKGVALFRPILLVTVLLNVYSAFFWTVGPLFAEHFTGLNGFEGLFIGAYELPILFVGWFIGSLTVRYGTERFAFLSLGAGSFVLMFVALVNNPFAILALVALSSFFVSMSVPATMAAYADYVTEAPKVEREIEELDDFAANLGYIIGPITAGILADLFGNSQAFSILGVVCFVISLIMLKAVPKKIRAQELAK